jgi:hypothetical protein
MLSFNLEEFLGVLERFNKDIWPLQILIYVLGIFVLFLLIRKNKYSDRIILAILALLWLWNGIIFCPFYWATTYKYAYLFGALFILQGIIFLVGVFKPNISFGHLNRLNTAVGIVFIIYAMAGYQLLGYSLGHVYPEFFPFGLVPCPTAIFTFGVLLITNKKIPGYYLLIPAIFAAGGFLAVSKGVFEDIGLIIAGLTGSYLLLRRS